MSNLFDKCFAQEGIGMSEIAGILKGGIDSGKYSLSGNASANCISEQANDPTGLIDFNKMPLRD